LFKTFKACFLVAESKAMMRELKDNVAEPKVMKRKLKGPLACSRLIGGCRVGNDDV